MTIYVFQFFLMALMVVVDLYLYQAIKLLYRNKSPQFRRTINIVFWAITLFSVLTIIIAMIYPFYFWPPPVRNIIIAALTTLYATKAFPVIFMIVEDIVRGITYLKRKWASPAKSFDDEKYESPNAISRSQFILRTGFIASLLPFAVHLYGVTRGGYDYTFIQKNIGIPGLPQEFDGLRVVQISDLHAGGFPFASSIDGVMEQINKYEPDIIFFTGDLVNQLASEVDRFIPFLQKLKAPEGIFSVLGNHDYGEYLHWEEEEEQLRNARLIVEKQEQMGWQVLQNEHHIIERAGKKLAIIGVENWSGIGRFQQYGDVEKAAKGTEDSDTKFLLTHDPSHWEEKILKEHPEIEMTFAGHTHGMQFGSDHPRFTWSPVSYVYTYWFGHYIVQGQQIYVNRGLGFTGFPGRIGMTPEITVLDFHRS